MFTVIDNYSDCDKGLLLLQIFKLLQEFVVIADIQVVTGVCHYCNYSNNLKHIHLHKMREVE